jgi:hypothetical protein
MGNISFTVMCKSFTSIGYSPENHFVPKTAAYPPYTPAESE